MQIIRPTDTGTTTEEWVDITVKLTLPAGTSTEAKVGEMVSALNKIDGVAVKTTDPAHAPAVSDCCGHPLTATDEQDPDTLYCPCGLGYAATEACPACGSTDTERDDEDDIRCEGCGGCFTT